MVLDTGSKEEIVQQLDAIARELLLVLTEGQKEWAEEFGTNWRGLWAGINKVLRKVRSPVAFFIWRLLYRVLPWAAHMDCPLCGQERSSINFVFRRCKTIQPLRYMSRKWREQER